TASTSLRASRRSWSTIASKIWQHFSTHCARKVAMCSRRQTTPSTGNSDGSWIQRATRLSSGNRHKGNEERLLIMHHYLHDLTSTKQGRRRAARAPAVPGGVPLRG